MKAGGRKDEGLTKGEKATPSSFILHPSSFTLHPSSFTLHPSSFTLQLSAFIAAGLVAAALLAPHLVLGRSLVPLDMLPLFQPWRAHAGEPGIPPVEIHNPLLDSVQQYYPRRVLFTRAVREGWLPFWEHNVYCGSPFAAAQQGAIWYPPAWLLTLLPPHAQFAWSAWLHLWLAAAGGYAFFRLLRAPPVAALAGGLAFALNGFVLVWLPYPNVTQWTLCWLPPALACSERGGFRPGGARWRALAALCLAMALLGGHAQSSAYVFIAWGLWAVLRPLTLGEGPAGVARGLSPAALAAGMGMVQLLPALDFLPRTDRAERLPWESVQGAAMPAAQLWTMLLPRLFGDGTANFAHLSWLPSGGRAELTYLERSFYPGIGVLLLALMGLAVLRPARPGRSDCPPTAEEGGHRLLATYGIGLALLALLWAFATPAYWPLWRWAPGFGQFTAVARVICLAGWGLACLAAAGATRCLSQAPTAGTVVAPAVGLALLAGAGHYVYGGAAPLPIQQALSTLRQAPVDRLAAADLLVALATLAGVGVGLLLARRRTALGVPLLLAFMTGDLLLFGSRFLPAADPAVLNARLPEIERLQQLGPATRILAAGGEDLKERMPSNLPAAFGLPDVRGSDSFVTQRYRAWEGLSPLVAPERGWPTPGLRRAGVRWRLRDGVQEDPDALPFARLHSRIRAGSPEELPDAALADPATAVLEGSAIVQGDGPARVIPFRTSFRNGNRLLLEGVAPTPGLLVVCEQYDPGWKVRVNGAAVRPRVAELMLLAVPLEAGSQRVELNYEPDTIRVGLFCTLAALVVAALLLAGLPRRRP